MNRTSLVAIAAVVVSVVSTSAAFAQSGQLTGPGVYSGTPQVDGTVRNTAPVPDGVTRNINPTQPVIVYQSGAKGDTGNTGAPGAPGATGGAGAPGYNGWNGLNGVGTPGERGGRGRRGRTGGTGATGAPGLSIKGDRGDKGDKGDDGRDGRDATAPIIINTITPATTGTTTGVTGDGSGSMLGLWILLGLALIIGGGLAFYGISTSGGLAASRLATQNAAIDLGQTAFDNQAAFGAETGREISASGRVSASGGCSYRIKAKDTPATPVAPPAPAAPATPVAAPAVTFSDHGWELWLDANPNQIVLNNVP